MFDLKGKSALISGATGGIGEAIARALYAQGATLALAGRSQDKMAEYAQSFGERAHPVEFELTSTESVKAAVARTLELCGKIDILVNNAGMARDALAMRMSDDEWQAVIDVNLTGTFKMTREVLPAMVKARYGRIISISSIVGTMGNPGQANYCATKAGITGMTKAIAAEVATRGITANCVAPGFIKTAMTDILSEEVKNKMMSVIPAGRFGDPADVAAATVFLASDEAAYITGQTIHVNGGMLRV
ncbi:MAG: 3-oxoacyl-[acyl-carrier-protein] reductase [Rickettsiales bacterium]|jgi:3-oxoacyl-[acyl-carrier protein] reductase|nr:3-oxoacyl-[acyl-carrier-protein] reductase [Rickettsiales bacterium]